MDYLLFDLLALALPTAVLLATARTSAPWHAGRRTAGPVAVLVLVALVWTAPWDEHLVRSGVWTYAPDGVLARIGSVPVEEYLFVILEVALVAAWGLRCGALPGRPVRVDPGGRLVPALCWASVAALGLALALAGGQLRYLGLLLLWAAPPLALQRAVAGDVLRARRAQRLLIALPVALWLCVADRTALASGIWSISPDSSTGVMVLGLPVEEGLFFVLTCLLVTDGLVLACDRAVVARVRALLPSGRRRTVTA